MDQETIELWRLGLIVLVFGGIIVLELLFGVFRPAQHGSRRETMLDILAASQAWLLVGPAVVYLSAAIETSLIPQYAGAWAGTHWALQVLAFLIFDDLVQYSFHRATHKFGWLWGLHKFHHSPPFMGVRIIWRNGFFYDLLLPNLYLSGILVYLGFGEVYLYYYGFKIVVTMASHSTLRWDRWLYQYKALSPLAWVIERTFSTPATHFAHHAALHDPVGNPNGNFGNLMFLWDVIFGTAKITRQYPQEYGLPEEPGGKPDPWYVYIFYPLLRAKRSTQG